MQRAALELSAQGAFVAADMVESGEGVASLRRLGHSGTDEDLTVQLERAADEARAAPDYSSATATPRRDMNPALAERLGINTAQALTSGAIANLLNGQRADGQDIPGKQKQAGTEGIGTVFGLDEDRMPTRGERNRLSRSTPSSSHRLL